MINRAYLDDQVKLIEDKLSSMLAFRDEVIKLLELDFCGNIKPGQLITPNERSLPYKLFLEHLNTGFEFGSNLIWKLKELEKVNKRISLSGVFEGLESEFYVEDLKKLNDSLQDDIFRSNLEKTKLKETISRLQEKIQVLEERNRLLQPMKELPKVFEDNQEISL